MEVVESHDEGFIHGWSSSIVRARRFLSKTTNPDTVDTTTSANAVPTMAFPHTHLRHPPTGTGIEFLDIPSHRQSLSFRLQAPTVHTSCISYQESDMSEEKDMNHTMNVRPVVVPEETSATGSLVEEPSGLSMGSENAAADVLPPGVSPAVTSPSSTRASQPLNPDNLGAQLLRNRFLSLKERANQNAQTLWAKNSPALSENAKAVQERAEQLWKTAAPILPVTGFLKQPGIFVTPPNKETESSVGETKKIEVNNESTAETESHPIQHGTELRPRQLSLSDPENDKDGQDVQIGADPFNSKVADGDDTSSVGGTSDVAALLLTGRALTRASLAASVAFESVTTFRGRYNASAITPTSQNKDGAPKAGDEAVTDNRPLPESQLELILKSRVGQHMQEILDKLEPHEFAMLLGRGMLGVNLKQCYLKNHGVFIDFMVPGGQAENSGVIRSGDLPVRLGDIDLRKGTILDIPMQISQARRPVVLVLATGSAVTLERMNYIDVTVAMMHRARDYYTKRGSLSILPSAASPARGESTLGSGDADVKSVSDVTVPPGDTIDSFLTPPAPNLDIRRDFQDEVPLRYGP